ncbi:hypothetical protein Hanom_Chr09g00790471 [Helianthus anomalus]
MREDQMAHQGRQRRIHFHRVLTHTKSKRGGDRKQETYEMNKNEYSMKQYNKL